MAPTRKPVADKKDSKKTPRRESVKPSKRTPLPRPIPKQQKTKSFAAQKSKSKKKIFSDKELDLPKFNMITPAGVQKPKGQKKGKVFVDDQESMMTILAMVNADKEGQIESKMIKARQLEEIREARLREAEKKQEEKKTRFDETRELVRRKDHKKKNDAVTTIPASNRRESRVKFAEI